MMCLNGGGSQIAPSFSSPGLYYMLILDILFKPLNYLSKIVDSINHWVGIAVAWLTA